MKAMAQPGLTNENRSRFTVHGSRRLSVRPRAGALREPRTANRELSARKEYRLPQFFLTAAWSVTFFFVAGLSGADTKIGREEGEFRISIGGKEIGNERFVIISSGDSASSTSALQFRNPTGGHEKILLETKLDMDGNYVPRRYELKSDVNGEKGSIVGTFNPNQAIFEYSNSMSARKSGLLVGNKFTLLDTNIFHHFIFIARLFDYDSKEKVQKLEVVIPQEPDSGVLKITEVKRESLTVKGRKVEVHHLQADSGTLLMDLWIDNQRTLQKIAAKSKNIEVIRN